MSRIMQAQRVVKSYPLKKGRLEVLKGIHLDIQQGEALCIMGASGSGKSTLLHILGTLDRPTLGRVTYRGEDLSRKSSGQLAKFRNQKMGFVFQFHHLLPELTALENASLPCRIFGDSKKVSEKKAQELLEYMGLQDRLSHYPSEMSGGERQRVAIARALVQKPEILLADEPTGNLDSENDRMILELFFKLKQELGLTLVVVTHNPGFSQRFPRVLKLQDGEFLGKPSASS